MLLSARLHHYLNIMGNRPFANLNTIKRRYQSISSGVVVIIVDDVQAGLLVL